MDDFFHGQRAHALLWGYVFGLPQSPVDDVRESRGCRDCVRASRGARHF